MDSILERLLTHLATNLVFCGWLSRKLVQFAPSPNGAKTPNPIVHFGRSVFVMYKFGTTTNRGWIYPSKPLFGTCVPAGGAEGINRNWPLTKRVSISIRKPS